LTLPGRPPPEPARGDPDAERVLSQALRAMAGGGKQARQAPDVGPSRVSLTTLQILLIATIAGLLIGMTVGLISLLA
jgi:hypothetical protein